MAINLRVEMAETQADPQDTLQETRRLVNQAIDTTRSLSHELSPTVLRERGLIPALHWLANTIEQRHQLPVTIETAQDAEPLISEEASEILFQTVRELLFNIVKHAQASRAWVKLEALRHDGLHLTVDDDGIGCDAEIIASDDSETGFGLPSIRERLAAWNGQLKAEPRPGGGCRIALELPSISLPETP